MPSSSAARTSSPEAPRASTISWRPTTMMNMRDLSRDDDFLSHLLVEKLGTGDVPLYVHKMDPGRRLPKTRAEDLLEIVRRLVLFKGPSMNAIRAAVDELLRLPSVLYYLRSSTQKQINAFATHASRYFELYCPSGSIEIAHTSRYSQHTGKSELCILATRAMSIGAVITELKGSMANLTEEEDRELKRTDRRNTDGGIRRDFSVIHSKQMKKNHLFLGPARFVNHDCDNNVELFREGRYITFRVIRPIKVGDEITAHYGDSYFGRKNRYCLCETCEKHGRGGYGPQRPEDEHSDSSNSDSDSSDDLSSLDSSSEEDEVNVNERRTRRGVYAVVEKTEKAVAIKVEDEDITTILASASAAPTTGMPVTPRKGAQKSQEFTASPSLTPISMSSEDSPGSPTKTQSGISARGAKKVPVSQLPTAFTKTLPLVSASAGPSRSGTGTEEPERRSLRPRTSVPSYLSLFGKRRKPVASDSPVKVEPTEPVAPPPKRGPGRPRKNPLATSLSAPLGGLPKKRGRPSNAAKAAAAEEARRQAAAAEAAAAAAAKAKPTAPLKQEPEIFRDKDGKVLPTCATCTNILPVIALDNQIVWGLEVGSSPKKGKGKQKEEHKLECPRCIRHFAIYGLPWPGRLASKPHGSQFLPTPREEATPVDTPSSQKVSRKVSHKTLPTLDKKLEAAALSKAKRKRDDGEERPAKKQKTDNGPVVKVSAAGKAALNIGRPGRPLKHVAAVKVGTAGQQPRKRGRPRKIRVDMPGEQERAAVASNEQQPREQNGRFGKKQSTNGRHSRKKVYGRGRPTTRHYRQVARTRTTRDDEWEDVDGAEEATPTREKRRFDHSSERTPTSKRLRVEGSPDAEVELVGTAMPGTVRHVQLTLAASSGPKIVGGLLYRTPNPTLFASRRWASVVPGADAGALDQDLLPATQAKDGRSSTVSSASDDEAPVTPDDNGSPAAIIVDGTDEPDAQGVPVAPYTHLSADAVARLGSLTWKPSPVNFSMRMRRWSISMRRGSPLQDADHGGVNDTDDSETSSTISLTQPRPTLRRVSGRPPSACLLEASASTATSVSMPTVIDLTGDDDEEEPPSVAKTASPRDRLSLQSLLIDQPLPGLTSKDMLLKPGSVHWLRKKALFEADVPRDSPSFVQPSWETASDGSADALPC